MKKHFDAWNRKKKNIDDKRLAPLYFKEREVWWCSLGVNVGFEEDGKGLAFQRPIVIVRKFNLDTCLVLPLTTRIKTGRYYFDLEIVAGRHAIAILSQLRFIDRKRLTKKMGFISEAVFFRLKQSIISANFDH